MTDVTSHVHNKFPVCFLLYIATKKTCQIKQIVAENSSMNAPISDTSQKKITLARLACLCLKDADKIVQEGIASSTATSGENSLTGSNYMCQVLRLRAQKKTRHHLHRPPNNLPTYILAEKLFGECFAFSDDPNIKKKKKIQL